MKKLIVYRTLISALLTLLLLPACATVQPALQLGVQVNNLAGISPALTFPDTLHGIQTVLQSQPNTFVYKFGSDYILGFPWKSAWGIASFDETGFAARHLGDWVRASRTSPYTVSSLLKFVEDGGGRQITPDKLPPTLLTALSDLVAWAIQVGAYHISIPIFILPGMINPSCINGCVQE